MPILVFISVIAYSAHENIANVNAPTPHLTLSSPSAQLASVQSSSSTRASSVIASTSTQASNSTPVPIAPIAVATTSTGISTTTLQARALTAAGGQLLKAMVNIVCVSGDPSLPSISASGVIVDPRGIIVTAAHVAQFFLLQDYLGSNKVICIIRTGSPARRAYIAEPIYVSPEWVAANPTTLTSKDPTGTGENDFAFVAITGTATSTPVPTSFPFVPLATQDVKPGDQVAIGSYGAQFLTASEINTSLYPILVFGSIQNQYTFATNTVDLVSILGSAASQEGSSGGGIVNAEGQLAGIITTSSITGNLDTRSLNAITIGHIRRSYSADTGVNLDTALQNSSLTALVAGFANESKVLGEKIITAAGIK